MEVQLEGCRDRQSLLLVGKLAKLAESSARAIVVELAAASQ